MIETDKSAYFTGEKILVVRPGKKVFETQKKLNVYISPVGSTDKDLVWAWVAIVTDASEISFKAPETTGLFAIGTDETGHPAIERIIQVVSGPGDLISRLGTVSLGTVVVGIATVGGLAYLAYKKLRK
jgi:hypothetical protein